METGVQRQKVKAENKKVGRKKASANAERRQTSIRNAPVLAQYARAVCKEPAHHGV